MRQRSMKGECMAADEILVSFDVTSLFTNVSTDEAVEVIHRRLLEDEKLEERTPLSIDRISELLRLCLKSIYFGYNGEFYEQRKGFSHGFPCLYDRRYIVHGILQGADLRLSSF